MAVRIIESMEPGEYNRHAHHPLQSWQWGEARKKNHTQIMRFGEYEDETLKNVFLMSTHPLPYTSYKLGYIQRSIVPSKEVIEFLQSYAKEHNLIFIKLEPDQASLRANDNERGNPDETAEPVLSKVEGSSPRNDGINIKRSPHPLFPDWTMVLDLTKSEEELLKNMKPKTRYNIRLAEKKGVTVKEQSDDEGYKAFEKLYFETTKRQKYFGHQKKYHQIVWDTMKEGIAHILIAWYEGEPLAGYELFFFNDTLYYPYGGTSEKHRNVMAANLIMWEAIKLGKKLGAKKFDMWGAMAPGYDDNHPWAGFTRFKEGYGAEFTEMIGSYDLVINPLAYSLYGLAHKARSYYLKLKA